MVTDPKARMGTAISFLLNVKSSLEALFQTIRSLNKQYQSLSARINAPPPGPAANATEPYWLEEPPFPDLVDMQTRLQDEADVVIIGSGITGAAAARTLCELSKRPLRIVVLEARQLCSGATARNGGHIKCAPYEAFASLGKKIGEEAARKVVRFQMKHADVLKEVGSAIPEGEVREVETVDFMATQEDMRRAKGQVEKLREWMPEAKCELWDAQEAREKVSILTYI
jgi:hypothetical protein